MEADVSENDKLGSADFDEVDIKEIYSQIIRNKKLISSITIFGFFLGIVYAFTAKKIWQGEFQIVLDDNLEKSELSRNLGVIPNFGAIEDPLETQVGILKSPLVLSEVFEFVKQEKYIKNNLKSNLKFKVWKKNSLDFYLEKGTSILNISYRDDKKKIILPVLERISNSYQEYSGRDRLREIELSKKFFEKQIEVFKTRSLNSLRNAQNFATDQDITILTGDSSIDMEIPNIINIEAIRVENANAIRNIDIQLAQVEQLDDTESIMYLGRSIPELVNQGLPQKLDDIDRNLLKINDQLKQIEKLDNNSSSLILIARSIPELTSSGLPDRLEEIEEKLIRLNTFKEEILKLEENPEKIQYFGDSIPQLVATGLPGRLKQIETDLAFSKFVYQDNDKIILNLKRRREILIKVYKKQALGYLEADIIKTKNSRPKIFEKLKEQSINSLESKKYNLNLTKPRLISLLKKKSISFLEARKTIAEAKLKAAERPEGVLIEYRQLMNDANKDRNALDSLENQYRSILLEEARTKDPWELITTPTLLSKPVLPKKSSIAIISFFISFFFSYLFAIYLEKKKNIIFSIKEMNKLVLWKVISQLSIKEKQSFNKSLIYTLESILNENSNPIEILIVGDFDYKLINYIKDIIINIKLKKFKITDNIFDLNDSAEVIIFTGLGISTKEKCLEVAEKLKIKQKNIIGNIVIKDFILQNDAQDPIEMLIINSGLFLKKIKEKSSELHKKYNWKYLKSKLQYYGEVLKKNF